MGRAPGSRTTLRSESAGSSENPASQQLSPELFPRVQCPRVGWNLHEEISVLQGPDA